MKKIITFILFALLLLPLNGQIGRYPFYTATISDPYCPEYRAVYNAMTIKPGADTAAQQNIMFKRIIDTCDLDLFYVFAQRSNTNGEAFLNWIDPMGDYNCTGVNSPVFTEYQGIASDNSTSYLTTNYNPSTDATYFSQNSGTAATYNNTEISDGNDATMGVYITHIIRILPGASGNFQGYINTQTNLTQANLTTKGFTCTTRRSSSDVENYLNATSLGSGSINSTGVPNGNVFILCFNYEGSPLYYFPGQIAVALLGEGFSDEQEAEVYDAIKDYIDYLGL